MTVAAALLSLLASAARPCAGDAGRAGPATVSPAFASRCSAPAAPGRWTCRPAGRAADRGAGLRRPAGHRPAAAARSRATAGPPSQQELIDGRRRPDIRSELRRSGRAGQSRRGPRAAARGLPDRPDPGPRSLAADRDARRRHASAGSIPITRTPSRATGRSACRPTRSRRAAARPASPRCAHAALPRPRRATTGSSPSAPISDTVIEPRTFPIPVGVQTTDRPGQPRRLRPQRQPRLRRRPSSSAPR